MNFVMFGLSVEEAAKLHGHKGPWLVLGYKAGKRAKEILKPESEHDLYCIVKTPLKTPYTCAIDGIQAVSGCTLGKLSIEIKDSSLEETTYLFIDRRNNKRVEFKLRTDVPKLIDELYEKYGLERTAEIIESEDICKLFKEKLYD